MQICFFTDHSAQSFLPLTLTRPLDDLRIGIITIREKWEYYLSASKSLRLVHSHLENLFPKGTPNNEHTYWINSRFLPNNSLITSINSLKLNTFLIKNDIVIAAYLDNERSKSCFSENQFLETGLSPVDYSGVPISIDHLWDLLSLNGSQIKSDLDLLKPVSLSSAGVPDNVIVQNPENIFIGEGAVIESGCIIIADKAPVYIGPGATIEAGSIIRGPVALCEGATAKTASRISDGTTIGPVCKVGGEVMNTIFHSYSNKAHDGFVGNSLVGQWCNFGADTNTSNLKNNYSPVHLINWSDKKPYDQGIQFLGTILADHSKTAINTMLNTGTTCGVCSNIFISGFSPKLIESFSWLTDSGVSTYDIDKALDAMRAMMGRRNIELTSEYEKMIRFLFDNR